MYRGASDTIASPGYNADVLLQRSFLARVYVWMTIGLGISAIMALLVNDDTAVRKALFVNPGIVLFICLANFGLVWAISGWINRMSAMTATLLFMLYSALTGVMLSSLLMVYSHTALMSTFLITAGTFATMAVIGTVTKKDLSSIGHMALMALIGLIIAMVVNIFMQNALLAQVVNYIGVLVFVALTAYDSQKIKYMYMAGPSGSGMQQKAAISGALRLYLDFINLFLFILATRRRR